MDYFWVLHTRNISPVFCHVYLSEESVVPKFLATSPVYSPLVGDVNLVITGWRTLTPAINSANVVQGLKSQDSILIAVMIILIQLTS